MTKQVLEEYQSKLEKLANESEYAEAINPFPCPYASAQCDTYWNVIELLQKTFPQLKEKDDNIEYSINESTRFLESLKKEKEKKLKEYNSSMVSAQFIQGMSNAYDYSVRLWIENNKKS